MNNARHRLRYRSLDTMRHQFRCPVCGGEPEVTLDENHEPMLACRMHPGATLEER